MLVARRPVKAFRTIPVVVVTEVPEFMHKNQFRPDKYGIITSSSKVRRERSTMVPPYSGIQY